MAANIQGIVFDKDGTLFGFNDTWADWSVAFLTALAPEDERLRRIMGANVGFDWDTQEFEAGSIAVGAPVDEICVVLAGLHPELDAKAIEKVAFDSLPDSSIAPVCDLDALFLDLRNRGLALGVATNDFEASAIQQLNEAKIHHHFDFICGYDSGFGGKPEAGQILAFCEHHKLDPANVAMVGDSTHDLEAGRRAGVGLNVGVLTGPALHDDIAHLADVVMADISGLAELLQR
jgi:phosphoglycolate phosphatase